LRLQGLAGQACRLTTIVCRVRTPDPVERNRGWQDTMPAPPVLNVWPSSELTDTSGPESCWVPAQVQKHNDGPATRAALAQGLYDRRCALSVGTRTTRAGQPIAARLAPSFAVMIGSSMAPPFFISVHAHSARGVGSSRATIQRQLTGTARHVMLGLAPPPRFCLASLRHNKIPPYCRDLSSEVRGIQRRRCELRWGICPGQPSTEAVRGGAERCRENQQCLLRGCAQCNNWEWQALRQLFNNSTTSAILVGISLDNGSQKDGV